MAKLTITETPGLDGVYEADLDYFTNRELHLIKQQTGLRGGELDDAVQALDNDLMVAIAAVVLTRNGKGELLDLLWDAKIGSVQLDLADEQDEADASPPAMPTGSDVSENGNADASGSSGDSSRPLSAVQASDLSPTGTLP